MKYELHNMEAIEFMKTLPNKSVDAIITDLPYGTTACSWDEIIPFEPMWEQVNRINKGVFVTTASQPFTSKLIMSNIKQYKQELIWDKEKGSNPLLAKIRHMQSHENIIVFGFGKTTYNPQKTKGKKYKAPKTGNAFHNRTIGGNSQSKNKDGFKQKDNDSGDRYPLSVLKFPIHCGSKYHPTQKPEALYEYLIRTFTNELDTVLDFCMGSGTTGVACARSNRKFIGCESDKVHGYFEKAQERIKQAYMQEPLL